MYLYFQGYHVRMLCPLHYLSSFKCAILKYTLYIFVKISREKISAGIFNIECNSENKLRHFMQFLHLPYTLRAKILGADVANYATLLLRQKVKISTNWTKF